MIFHACIGGCTAGGLADGSSTCMLAVLLLDGEQKRTQVEQLFCVSLYHNGIRWLRLGDELRERCKEICGASVVVAQVSVQVAGSMLKTCNH